ncbi:MAG: hypothetical protein WA047_01795 [Phenylobacterium sp.]|uniref:hypothetical protein n=1 Tax=Phenylobacterium sp. TaxID=1871053 RepID=UPI003BB56B0F
MIDEAPSPAKLDLIRRFLRANGIQREIDTGSFLQRFVMTPAFSETTATVGQAIEALKGAYERHRAQWQEEYERHANWEFTEHELGTIVAFLEGPVGQHFLEGGWRMKAYVGSTLEAVADAIIREAAASFTT